MGNQMFQYAFGKLLEEKRKVPVYFICKVSEFRLNGFAGINYINSSNKFISLFERFFLRYRLRYKEFHSCLEEIDLNAISNFSYVSGYFQSSKVFEENRDFVKSLFKVSLTRFFASNDCVTHIRRGDYLTTIFAEINSNAVVPEEWFVNQLNYIKKEYSPENFKVVGDDGNYLKYFCKKLELDTSALIQSPMEDFVKLMTSKYLIISNSSFAWWAAFLNIHEDAVIIAPRNWVGFHVGIEYPKGIMNSRFIWR
ncbi:alpha-1,2-fucosyltransferase [Algoriphagus vanfongensis]|uniref:alpha-1,2-fucosyltransferase n=1 Tax=Algoriphagus vanfongensis TaxID=426371 RepID=UPI00068574DC|nr:alpha-1,2-fucosyltransferase [Algoriphagus vanfongensis]